MSRQFVLQAQILLTCDLGLQPIAKRVSASNPDFQRKNAAEFQNYAGQCKVALVLKRQNTAGFRVLLPVSDRFVQKK